MREVPPTTRAIVLAARGRLDNLVYAEDFPTPSLAASEVLIEVRACGGATVNLDLHTVYLKRLEIHGSSQGTRGACRDLLGPIESKNIQPLLHATYPLSEFHNAQTEFIRK